jgi:hypothetical protein
VRASFVRAAVFAVACVASAVACRRGAPPAPPAPASAPSPPATDTKPATAAVAPTPAFPVGMAMTAAFEPLDAASAKNFRAGEAALRAKKFPAARELFHLVVAAHPDHGAARFQELRAAVLAGDLDHVRDLWRELLARDFVAHATKLDAGAEFASLRASPLGPDLVRIRDEVRTAYAHGLTRGVLFVARGGGAKPPLWNQEAYHFDPATGRVRRLTDTGGQVFGILADRAHARLALLLVQALEKNRGDSGWSFRSFKAGVLSLATLENIGPVEVPKRGRAVSAVDMCVSAKGAPIWATTASYTFDPGGKRLVPAADTCAPGTGVQVTVNRGEKRRSPPPGVPPEIRGDGGARSVAMGWSPGKTRLVFAGDLDPCDASARPAENELRVWDAAGKKVAHLAKAFSFFEWDWLDDDHLAYETGPRSNPRIAVRELSTGKDTIVETRAGAGLVAVPTFTCVVASGEGNMGDEDDEPE